MGEVIHFADWQGRRRLKPAVPLDLLSEQESQLGAQVPSFPIVSSGVAQLLRVAYANREMRSELGYNLTKEGYAHLKWATPIQPNAVLEAEIKRQLGGHVSWQDQGFLSNEDMGALFAQYPPIRVVIRPKLHQRLVDVALEQGSICAVAVVHELAQGAESYAIEEIAADLQAYSL